MIEHIGIHIEELPYRCEFCGKRLKKRWHYYIHLRMHKTEKPYQCAICGKVYGSKNRLTDHCRNKHS